MNRNALWSIAVVAAAALGWSAAMYVQAGAPLRSEEDAYVRFRNALNQPDALERTKVLVRLFDQLETEQLPGAVRAYQEDLYPLDAVDLRMLMAYWAKTQPREMVQTVQEWSDTRAQRLAAAQAVYEIANAEGYAAARTFYDTLPTDQRDAALANLVIAHIDHGELEDLAGFISSFDRADEQELVANVAMHRMIRQHGPAVVQTWIEGLPAGRGSSSDLNRIAFRAAQSAHLDNGFRDEFIAWLDRVGETAWNKGAWRSIAVHWVRTDPMAGIAWARSLPPEKGRDDVAAEAIRIWAVRDAEAALEWILAQPASEELDRGTGRLAVHYSLQRPGLTFEMMERIVSQETFHNTRRSVDHTWNALPEARRAEFRARTKEMARARRAAAKDMTRVEPGAGAEAAAEGAAEGTG